MNKPLFLLFNFLISSNWLFKILFLIFITIFVLFFSVSEHFFSLDDNVPFGIAIWIGIFSLFFTWIFKVLIFILLFQLKRTDTYMGKFFEKIKNEKSYRYKVILYALLCDFFCLFIIPIILYIISNSFINNTDSIVNLLLFDIGSSVLWGGGITLSYLSLIIWLKSNKL